MENTDKLELIKLKKIVAQQAKELILLRNENAILRNKNYVDALTGVYTKAGMYDKLVNDNNNEYILANCDIDNFKNINDTFGHKIGDNVLRKIAIILEHDIKSGDFVVRYAGDEFYIFFKSTDMEKIKERLVIIQEKIVDYGEKLYAHNNIEVPSNKKLSMSIGVIEYNSIDDKIRNFEQGTKAPELKFLDLTVATESSDFAMYEGKKSGKGKIMTYKKK